MDFLPGSSGKPDTFVLIGNFLLWTIYIFVAQSADGNLMANLTGNVPVAASGILLVQVEDARSVAKCGKKHSALILPEAVLNLAHTLTGMKDWKIL